MTMLMMKYCAKHVYEIMFPHSCLSHEECLRMSTSTITQVMLNFFGNCSFSTHSVYDCVCN